MASTISAVKDASLKTWCESGFQVGVGVSRQPVLFDEIDDFGQADGRDDHPHARCGGLVDEVAGGNGQVCIIEKIPKGGMRIGDAGDH